MARRSGSTIQEELYSTPDSGAREEVEGARLIELDADKESPFLRAQKRVPARRSPLPKKTAARLLWAVLAILAAAVLAVSAAAFYRYSEHSWRFRLQTSDNIEMSGLGNVTRAQIMEVMGGDIGRNIFFIPLEQRKKQLEQIPWVESASVMRFAPDRIRIEIHERTPVAFARIGSKVMLVDAGGVLMDLSGRSRFSFPVVLGMSSSAPLSTRAAQMKIYNQLVRELDAGGAHYSRQLSEVDLTDPEDVKVLTNDSDGEVLVHLGSSNFLARFKVYVAHLREWRQQFQKVESVDLRYDRQIVVNPEMRGSARQAPLSAKVIRVAVSAGVKPTALLSREAAKSPAHAAVQAAVTRAPVSTQKPKSSRRRRKSVIKKASLKKPAPRTVQPRPAHWQKPSPSIAKGQVGH